MTSKKRKSVEAISYRNSVFYENNSKPSKETVSETSNATFIKNLKSYFSQYCGNTSMHGFRYLGEHGRYLCEKLIWTAILSVVWYTCVFLILKSYHKWQNNPIIVTFATTETHIWKIPFPAVTICPEIKYNPKEFNYSAIFIQKMKGYEVSEQDEKALQSFLLICDKEHQSPVIEKLQSVSSLIEDKEVSYLFQEYINYTLNNWRLKWLKKPIEDHSLSITLTEEGYCYTFNMITIEEILRNPEDYLSKRNQNLNATNWSLETGYRDDDLNDKAYPKRTFTAGINGGATFNLLAEQNHINHFCGNGLEGFKIVLHHPSEFPDMAKYLHLPLDHTLRIAIKPRMITVADNLRDYRPHDRNCYYSNEKYLSYFKDYTQSNCFSECLLNCTLFRCGCVPFYVPKDEDSPTCGFGNQKCVNYCKVHIGKEQFQKCDCLPSCTFLAYDVETSLNKWNWRSLFESLLSEGISEWSSKRKIDINRDRVSDLNIFFKEVQFLTTERHELYGYVDFFSNIGGLLGLFIGFSVISGLEIFYFLTLRLACNFKKYGRKVWSGDSTLLE